MNKQNEEEKILSKNQKKWDEASKKISKHLINSLKNINKKQIIGLKKFIINVKKRKGTLYLIAEGRSMDVLSMFGSRLTQDPIKLNIHQLTREPKPKIEKEDATLILTGTGETGPVIFAVKNWIRVNKNIALITSSAAKKERSAIFDVIKNPKPLILLSGIEPEDIHWKKNNPNKIHPPTLDALFFEGKLTVPGPTKFEMLSLLFLESMISEIYFTLRGDTYVHSDY